MQWITLYKISSFFLFARYVSAKACPIAGIGPRNNPKRLEEPERQLTCTIPISSTAKAKDPVDYKVIQKELEKVFKESKEFWPADFGHYAPFMIRLAWHCSGSFRVSDGRGGCDGARIRFQPELSWMDNTNLDKARKILEPIKMNHPLLSWGDLIVLAGTTAIQTMGGPSLGFCGGRIDDENGQESLPLGPSDEQKEIGECRTNGNCTFPLGPTTIGLIYVNPEGPMGIPDPQSSVSQIRDSFGRMGMNDRETVALIGGGHAFGKAHGACPLGPGPDPTQDPVHPWPGTCGEGKLKGKGPNTFTSGFEGAWTTTPTRWGNEYFQSLLNYEWEKFNGSGGHWQWKPVGQENLPIRFLTTDVALLYDESYKNLVKEYADNITSLEYDFSRAWYKLTTRDMGPVQRCKGDLVPPPQPFQLYIPQSKFIANYSTFDKIVKAKIIDLIKNDTENGARFSTLSYQCASTYRITDYSGGCSGARIRFPPEKEYPENKGLDQVVEVLEKVKNEIKGVSISDLIVYAGKVALEQMGTDGLPSISFQSGRPDATEVVVSELSKLAPRSYYSNKTIEIIDNARIMGLDLEEYVALMGRPRSESLEKQKGFSGTYSSSTNFSNEYFQILIKEKWIQSLNNPKEYTSQRNENVVIRDTDYALLQSEILNNIVLKYSLSQELYFKIFVQAWSKLMNADLIF